MPPAKVEIVGERERVPPLRPLRRAYSAEGDVLHPWGRSDGLASMQEDGDEGAPLAVPPVRIAAPLVRIVVRSPAPLVLAPGAVAGREASDFAIDVPGASSIDDVKAILERRHPSHPPPAQQRLIYRGHVLGASQTVDGIASQRCSDEADDGWPSQAPPSGPCRGPLDASAAQMPTIVLHMVVRGAPPTDCAAASWASSRPDSPHGGGDGCSTRPSSTSSPPPLRRSSLQRSVSVSSLCSSGSSSSSVRLAGEPAAILFDIVDMQGRAAQVNLRGALIFDGQAMYKVKGTSLSRPAAARGADGARSEQRPADAQRHRRPPERAAARAYRLRVSLATIFRVLFRISILLVAIAQGTSDIRLMIMCLCAVVVYLVQSGVIPVASLSAYFGRLWETIMEANRAPEAAAGPPLAHPRNVAAHLAEIAVTFFLSLLPTAPRT